MTTGPAPAAQNSHRAIAAHIMHAPAVGVEGAKGANFYDGPQCLQAVVS